MGKHVSSPAVKVVSSGGPSCDIKITYAIGVCKICKEWILSQSDLSSGLVIEHKGTYACSKHKGVRDWDREQLEIYGRAISEYLRYEEGLDD